MLTWDVRLAGTGRSVLGHFFVVVAVLLFISQPAEASAAEIVVPPGTGLQAAVASASSGDTIRLSGGTYTTSGQVLVDKDLSIVGAGMGLTVIKPGTDTGASGDPSGWFFVPSGNTLTIGALTLDGDYPVRKVYQAIRGRGVVHADSVSFTRISMGSRTGIGLMLYGAGSTVTGCTFDVGEGGAGIWTGNIAPSTGASTTVTGCTFIGGGANQFSQYGFIASIGGHALVEDSTFRNFGLASLGGYGSAGLRADTYYGAGTQIEVRRSTFTDSYNGIQIGYTAADTTDAQISDSTFDNVDVDMIAYGLPVRVLNNTFVGGKNTIGTFIEQSPPPPPTVSTPASGPLSLVVLAILGAFLLAKPLRARLD